MSFSCPHCSKEVENVVSKQVFDDRVSKLSEQKKTAEEVIAKLNAAKVFPARIVTEVTPASTFYPAEKYHQDYFANNPFQPYCQAVVSPKVEKVRKVFKDILK